MMISKEVDIIGEFSTPFWNSLSNPQKSTVVNFDEDWEPIGPMVRAQLMPEYMIENDQGKLELTAAGKERIRPSKIKGLRYE